MKTEKHKKEKAEKYKNYYLLNVIIIILAIISMTTAYWQYSKANAEAEKASLLESQIGSLNTEIDSQKSEINSLHSRNILKDSTIQSQKNQITNLQSDVQRLTNEVNQLEIEISYTKEQLADTTDRLEEAQPYQERVTQGQSIGQSYKLLQDYNDYAMPIALSYLGLTRPTAPSTDAALWERGRLIYDWISENYAYCGDKGLRIGTTFHEFQFFSPDELLMSDNARCGDCDDFASLFAGLMYASGVPANNVWVVCGDVEVGGHCWNWLNVGGTNYRIDPVCSQKSTIFSLLGWNFGVKGANFPSSFGNVGCFDEYTAEMRMNPEKFIWME